MQCVPPYVEAACLTPFAARHARSSCTRPQEAHDHLDARGNSRPQRLHHLERRTRHPIPADRVQHLDPVASVPHERTVVQNAESVSRLVAPHFPKIARNWVLARAVGLGSVSPLASRISAIQARSLTLTGSPMISKIAFAAVEPSACSSASRRR